MLAPDMTGNLYQQETHPSPRFLDAHHSLMVLRRSSTGASSLPGESSGLGSALRRVDCLGKVPIDLTEKSTSGGLLTLIMISCLLALFSMQLSALATSSFITEIVVDHSMDSKLTINVQIDFPRVNCDVLQLDAYDAMGSRRYDLSADALYKHPLGGALKYMHLEHASPAKASEVREIDENTDFQYYSNRKVTYDVVGQEMFERLVKVHQNGLLMVNFYAPWCFHCRDFAPIWEHASDLLRADIRSRRKSRLSAGMASVDCTKDGNLDLCDKLHIQAYPTVRVYRAGSLHPSRLNETIDNMHDLSDISFEMYHGKRSAQAISDFALSLLKEIESVEADGARAHTIGHDYDGDGVHDSTVRSPGCSVNGQFKVARVPGAFYFVARAHRHSIAEIDMTHIIKHISFGEHVPGRPSFIPRHLKRAWTLIPTDMGGRFSRKNDLAFTQFNGTPRTQFEHYMQVVQRTYIPIAEKLIQIYEYTFSSNQFDMETSAADRAMFAYDDDSAGFARLPDGPTVKFAYDLSPMQVVTRETRKVFIEWVLGCCAILGGLWTCMVGFESVIRSLFGNAMKKRLGKLS
jgi:thiol-disulfide isomerase/thioredoxin